MSTIEINTLSPIKWPANYYGNAPTLDSANGVLNGDIALDTITLAQWRCKDNTVNNPVWVALDTTAGLSNSTNKNLITDAQLAIVSNTTGVNSGDQSLAALVPYTGATDDVDIGQYTVYANVVNAISVIADTVITTVANVEDVATIVNTDATKGSIFRIMLTGAVTLANPTNAIDGQQITWWISQDGTGGYGVTLDSKFDVPTGATIAWDTTQDTMCMLMVRYSAQADKYHVVSFISGYAAI